MGLAFRGSVEKKTTLNFLSPDNMRSISLLFATVGLEVCHGTFELSDQFSHLLLQKGTVHAGR